MEMTFSGIQVRRSVQVIPGQPPGRAFQRLVWSPGHAVTEVKPGKPSYPSSAKAAVAIIVKDPFIFPAGFLGLIWGIHSLIVAHQVKTKRPLAGPAKSGHLVKIIGDSNKIGLSC